MECACIFLINFVPQNITTPWLVTWSSSFVFLGNSNLWPFWLVFALSRTDSAFFSKFGSLDVFDKSPSFELFVVWLSFYKEPSVESWLWFFLIADSNILHVFSIVAGLHLLPPPMTFLTKLTNFGFFLGILSKVIIPSSNDLTSLSIVLPFFSTASCILSIHAFCFFRPCKNSKAHFSLYLTFLIKLKSPYAKAVLKLWQKLPYLH